MGNAGPSPSKQFPSTLALFSLPSTWERDRGTCLPLSLVESTYTQSAFVAQVSALPWSVSYWSSTLSTFLLLPVKVLVHAKYKLEKVLLSYTCFLFPAAAPHIPSTPTWISFLGLLHSKVPQTGWLRNIPSHSSRSRKSQIRVSHVPSETCRESLTLFQFGILSEILWLNRHIIVILYFHKVLSTWVFTASSSVDAIDCVQISPLWIRAHSNNLILTWLNLQRPYLK